MKCIRRPHAVWTTCKCDACAPVVRRISKANREGRFHRVPSEAAWVRIIEWDQAGFTAAWIASVCGMAPSGISSILADWRVRGAARKIGPRYSRQIIQADIWSGTAGRAPTLGSQRRLQALAWLGYSGTAIQAETGISFVTIAQIQRGETSFIRASQHHAIKDAYERLECTPRVGPQSVAHARRNGWLPPATWDNPDTDRPEEARERVA